MARVKYLEKSDVNEELRWIYDKYEGYGRFMNQVRVFSHRPVLLKHLMGMLLEMAEEPIVDKRHTEIALVAVSKLNECRYCVAHHVPRLLDTGLEGFPFAVVENHNYAFELSAIYAVISFFFLCAGPGRLSAFRKTNRITYYPQGKS